MTFHRLIQGKEKTYRENPYSINRTSTLLNGTDVVMPAQETQAKRLDRIEGKIDKLADAMVFFARTEEKILSMEKETITTSRE